MRARAAAVSCCARGLAVCRAGCALCSPVSHVYVCVFVRRIDSRSKTILLGSQVCVCVCVWVGGGREASKARG
jgi:hypothetical protein